MSDSEKSLILKSLRLDGVTELYLPELKKQTTRSQTKVAVPKPNTTPEKSTTLDKRPVSQVLPKTQENLSSRDKMIQLRKEALACTRCNELCQTRKKVVFGSGTVDTDLVFIGEAPGRDEDEQGLPFVGAAGQLLTKIIEAIGYTRNDVFICNVLKCRPPANRTPKPNEIINCQGYLREQINIIKPKMICCLGNFAAQTLLETQSPMSELRNSFHQYEGITVACTYHPAYLLRNPADKKKVWEDMQRMKKELETLSHNA